jgi:hypothetical protein
VSASGRPSAPRPSAPFPFRGGEAGLARSPGQQLDAEVGAAEVGTLTVWPPRTIIRSLPPEKGPSKPSARSLRIRSRGFRGAGLVGGDPSSRLRRSSG